ncbi:hypothetical protein [Pseudotabrizicola sp. L79]|uniref:hypothetical protein n=1 Tax=Pseudotabrizicola sp. L79 TaxID=3118402 RepID=UPI002F952509
MKVQLFAGMALIGLAACGPDTRMQLYPTSGPLAETSPPPAIAVAATNVTGTSGELRFRLPDKTRCKGTWSSVVPRVQSQERGLNLSIRDLGGKLTRSSETVGGVNSGEIYAVCRDGTIVQGRFAMGSGTTSGTGSATDSRGNTFKLLF